MVATFFLKFSLSVTGSSAGYISIKYDIIVYSDQILTSKSLNSMPYGSFILEVVIDGTKSTWGHVLLMVPTGSFGKLRLLVCTCNCGGTCSSLVIDLLQVVT